MPDIVIVAPHADDELIGCFEILRDIDTNPIIIYSCPMDDKRRQEVNKLKTVPTFVTFKAQMFLQTIPPNLLNKGNTFYFPDPFFEKHPAHRAQGMIGEQLARGGEDVYFYSTSMDAPYIRETKNPEMKQEILNVVYPSQSDLWKYDHKYFLFEGYCKWIF